MTKEELKVITDGFETAMSSLSDWNLDYTKNDEGCFKDDTTQALLIVFAAGASWEALNNLTEEELQNDNRTK